jgi:virginiamycin A acetyltransferase
MLGARFLTWNPEDTVEIGSFCALAEDVRLIAGGNHNFRHQSIFPFSLMFGGSEPVATGSVIIGNDVWLGTGVICLGNARIGNSAVIGAGAVVTGEIPSYAIAVGNPARVIDYRFTQEERALLERTEWWNWPEEMIHEAEAYLRSSDVRGLHRFGLAAHPSEQVKQCHNPGALEGDSFDQG